MESLGIDIRMLVAQIFNFLVLFFLLNKFLYRPILKFLDERKKKIEEGLLNAEKMTKQLADLEEKKSELMHQAQNEANVLISQERKLAEEEKEKIVEEARQKAAEEIKKGEILAKQELQKAKEELRKEAVELAASMAKKLVQDIPGKEKHRLIEESLK